MNLEEKLKQTLEGEVRFDASAKALYATDASNYRQIPIGVIYPKHAHDVQRALEVCREFDVPVLSRGAGTSLAGQCCNVAVVFDFSKYMNRILEIDPAARTATVEPGVILDHLRAEAEKYGLTFGPDPATHSRCTLGGMIGNNSCGVHAIAWGKTVENVESLEVITYDGVRLEVGSTLESEIDTIIGKGGRRGDIYKTLKDIRDTHRERIHARYPKIPRRVSGYNLDELLPEKGFHVARALVGTEGTCVMTLKARLRLVPSPKIRRLLVLGYPTIYDAADEVPKILESKPLGLEGMDLDLITHLGRYQGFPEKIRLLPTGAGWLLVEFGGETHSEAEQKAMDLVKALGRGTLSKTEKLCLEGKETHDIWSIRESVLAATAFVAGQPDRHEGWEDSAVRPEKLGAYLRDLRALYDRYGYKGAFYGHFGDGCLHTRIDFDLETSDGRQATRRFLDEAADLVIQYGGSFSGEHGDGQARGELLPKMYGPELIAAFEQFKAAWDPQNKMNPGKVVKPNPILSNLRHLKSREPAFKETHFHFPKQENDFGRAVQRCVGVGKCRNEEGGLMCPSYQITRDEKHSTRGRARLLFEMMQGETITDGWKSEEIHEALDLCLSCKGCKNECPTNVDMATFKAEFLSHYYETHRRPLRAYFYAYAEKWLRWGSKIPGLANLFSLGPRLANRSFYKSIYSSFPAAAGGEAIDKKMSGLMDPLPETAGDDVLGVSKKTVMLWVDTFTNYLNPDIAKAAIKVLEHLGYKVLLPQEGLCCGRPLYDWGLLDEAKTKLRDILAALAPAIEAGIPLVGLEPGCLSVFRDELVNLFPEDERARKLSGQTFIFSEFLLKIGADILLQKDSLASAAPSLTPATKVILQTHCHHKSVMNGASDRQLLERLGYVVEEPESGCCGMAGAFGLEKDHKSLSLALGHRALAPAIQAASSDAIVVADGFSCREQISRTTGRKALHIAELLGR